MTAKLKHGYYGGEPTRGADEGSTQEQLLKDHRRPGRPEGAPLSMNETDDNEEAAGELPQHRNRDDAQYPQPIETPPKGEGPSAGPPSMDYQNTGEGPATDDGGGQQ
jgi:hypothetical protein